MTGSGVAAGTPNAELAATIAKRVTGYSPTNVRRFATGARHYVFDVEFADEASVVVRIGSRSAHAEMEGASGLSGLLRPLGMPLPAILAEDVRAELPWLMLERLPGTDLGAIIGGLSEDQLDRIAAAVASAQAIVAKTKSAGRYGYAASPELAPHLTWSLTRDQTRRISDARRGHGAFRAFAHPTESRSSSAARLARGAGGARRG